MADDVKVTYLPPGEALGARDLQRWAHRRAVGKAGAPPMRKERKRIKQRQRAALRAGVRTKRGGEACAMAAPARQGLAARRVTRPALRLPHAPDRGLERREARRRVPADRADAPYATRTHAGLTCERSLERASRRSLALADRLHARHEPAEPCLHCDSVALVESRAPLQAGGFRCPKSCHPLCGFGCCCRAICIPKQSCIERVQTRSL